MYWYEDKEFIDHLKGICKEYDVKKFKFSCDNGIGEFISAKTKINLKYLVSPARESISNRVKDIKGNWITYKYPAQYYTHTIKVELWFEVSDIPDRDSGLQMTFKMDELRLYATSFSDVHDQLDKFRNRMQEFYLELNNEIVEYGKTEGE